MTSSDWTCSCGRSSPATRTKCVDCGKARDAAAPASAPKPSSPGRPASARYDAPEPVKRRPDKFAPVPPNEPGASPFVFEAAAPALELPHACVCCSGPPSRRTIMAVAERTDLVKGTHWIDQLFGRKKQQGGFQGSERSFEFPACETCYRHETVRQAVLMVVVVIAIMGAAVTVGKFLPAKTPLAVGIALVAWAVGAVVLTFVGSAIIGRRSSACAPGNPAKATWRANGVSISFANRSWGQRVAELNEKRH